jgi:hypothetical protein
VAVVLRPGKTPGGVEVRAHLRRFAVGDCYQAAGTQAVEAEYRADIGRGNVFWINIKVGRSRHYRRRADGDQDFRKPSSGKAKK